jgi:hemerythrin-like domain-containing protein
MNKATGTLRREHEAILRMLDATEDVARRFRRGETVPVHILKGLREFFQLFADRCHHGKEEDLLFPMLESKGMPRAGGPVGVMLQEHTLGRTLVGQMSEATDRFEAGEPAAGQRWAEAASGYANLLRLHIQKENNVLFVMAEQLLTDAEQNALAEAFDQVETDKLGAGTHERLHALMDQMLAELSGQSGPLAGP